MLLQNTFQIQEKLFFFPRRVCRIDPDQMQAAIATSSIDTVKATISNIKAQQAAAAALTPEQLQAIAEAQAQAAQAQQDAAAGN